MARPSAASRSPAGYGGPHPYTAHRQAATGALAAAACGDFAIASALRAGCRRITARVAPPQPLQLRHHAGLCCIFSAPIIRVSVSNGRC
nr:unnamed protein product [Digitaria exilis]